MSLRAAREEKLKIGDPAVALPITIACGLGAGRAADLLGQGRLGRFGSRLRVGLGFLWLRSVGHGATLAGGARCGKPARLKNHVEKPLWHHDFFSGNNRTSISAAVLASAILKKVL